MLDDMSVSWQSFIVAVAIFTVVEVIAQPLITSIAVRSAPALRGSVALVTTFVGLVVTDFIADGLRIQGASTWVLATIIVWLGALVAALILPILLVKRALDDGTGGRAGGRTVRMP